jgi:hypothetical protein
LHETLHRAILSRRGAMTEFRYEAVKPLPHAELIEEFKSGVPDRIATALYSAARFDDDWHWVEEQCLNNVAHESARVRWAAVTCLGDLALFKRPLKLNAVIPALERALADPEIADPAAFSLSMVKQFCK